MTAAATTLGYDPATTTDVNGQLMAPNSIKTFTVTIKPTAAPGTVVRGHINLLASGESQGGIDQVIQAIPYSYTVGQPAAK